MSLPNVLAITRNSRDANVHTEQAFPAEIAWLTGDGPIRSVAVAPRPEWLECPLAVDEHGLTWDTLKSEGKPLREVLEMVDRDLAGKVVYCYERDFDLWQTRTCPFELRWFETPEISPEQANPLLWHSMVCRSATKWARKTTVEFPPERGSTQIVYALNYYSMMVDDLWGERLLKFLDGWTRPVTIE